ncbi:hypothetical protein K470DRAFT_254215 [Piedraia hortae CBS 480.64]|uniref:Peroxisomal membrane protein Pex17 n=1 Tax=Piedraia hortae CBS 480.64 TaxID=1314780 RepID=A0A6A7CAN4_9PEZI|nr:hypothetical protein K470DRAFT_254215 [Piedraia hortae CBS 480.64]
MSNRLATLLRALQFYSPEQDTALLLGSASSILAGLNNPLNITTLSRLLLTAPAIWTSPDLRTSLRCFSAFHSAVQSSSGHGDEWVAAAIAGADESSPRWRHALILGGLLLANPRARVLEASFVSAVNAALADDEHSDLARLTITLVLTYCFPALSPSAREKLDHNRLLPVLMLSLLEGLHSGYFLGAIEPDIQALGDKIHWDVKSPSYRQVETMVSSPLVSILGPLTQLIGHTIEHVRNARMVEAAVEDVRELSRIIYLQWRQTRFSGVESSTETELEDADTHSKTVPTLWKLLRSILYGLVVILRSAVSRLLITPSLNAPQTSTAILHTLRHVYFITTRVGTFSGYSFVWLTSLDILAAFPREAQKFVHSIQSEVVGTIPSHALDRLGDLFFFNVAEHLVPVLPLDMAEGTILASATPYITTNNPTTDPNSKREIFEAAHSAMLSVFCAEQNVLIAAKWIPSYTQSLFDSFPAQMSHRQFRFAFATLIRTASPPGKLYVSEPMLAGILLEILAQRARDAASLPMPEVEDGIRSQRAVYILAIVDSLPQVSVNLLEEWLPLVARLIRSVPPGDREICQGRLWEVFGEMDPQRAKICAGWWGTFGGRELVLG